MNDLRSEALAAEIGPALFAVFGEAWSLESAWLSRNRDVALLAVQEAVTRAPRWSEAREDELRAALRAALRQPVTPRKQAQIPAIPMTIADLRRMEPPARRNPAPQSLGESWLTHGGWTDGALQQIGMENTDAARNWALSLGWEMTAPEGYPPLPRRGSVYSKDEAQELAMWMRRLWPLARELEARYFQPRVGGPHVMYGTTKLYTIQQIPRALLSGLDSMAKNALSFNPEFGAGINRPHAAAGKTPEQWAAMMARYAYDYFRPLVLAEEYAERYPDLLKQQSDPDAHMEQMLRISRETGLWSEQKTREFLWNMYVRDRYIPATILPAPWTGRERDGVLSPESEAPLSAQIVARDAQREITRKEMVERQERADREMAERERRQEEAQRARQERIRERKK